MRILLVEDQADLARHISRALRRSDHEVVVAGDGPSGVEGARQRHFDLIVLDLNLPGFDGLEVMRRIAPMDARPRCLMLTSRSEVDDRVTGLKAGADDYLTKPFAMEELLARVEALGRRVLPGVDSNILTNGDLSLDIVRRRLLRDGQTVDLSPREFELLQIFMHEPGRIFSRGELFERIWARSHTYETKTVEIFIMRLRKKLEAPGHSPIIETVRGIGYRLREKESSGSDASPVS